VETRDVCPIKYTPSRVKYKKKVVVVTAHFICPYLTTPRMTPDVCESKLEIYDTGKKKASATQASQNSGVYRCELISNARTGDFYSHRQA
jgi:hypothetical protein